MNRPSSVRRAAIRLPSTEGLRAFEAVARLGSFERAAHELSLTASAVSKRVSSLEEVAGTSLFTRKANALVLTDAGMDYATRSSEVLRQLMAMPQHGRTREASGRLSITSTPTFARQILAPNLSAFTNAHPHFDVELLIVPPIFDYPATNADVEIRNGDVAASGGILLMQDVVTPLVSPDLLLRLPPLRVPGDLRHAPLIRTPLKPWSPWFHSALLDWPEPARGPKLLDLGLTFEAAVNGHGIALCRPSLVRDWLTRRALRPLFDIFARPTKQYYVLADVQQQASQLFVQWLQAVCSDNAEGGLDLIHDELRHLQDGIAGS